MISRERRDELRGLRAAATAGEWVAFEHLHAENAVGVKGFEQTRRIADVRTDPADYGRANARYIAASANSLIDALDSLEAVEAKRDELAEALRVALSASTR